MAFPWKFCYVMANKKSRPDNDNYTSEGNTIAFIHCFSLFLVNLEEISGMHNGCYLSCFWKKEKCGVGLFICIYYILLLFRTYYLSLNANYERSSVEPGV